MKEVANKSKANSPIGEKDLGVETRTARMKLMKEAFNPEEQAQNCRARIIAGIERLSTIFRADLQAHSKELGLSPLQIQIVLFIAYHHQSYCNTSTIAQEFAVTKPTVSDAVRVLIEKKILFKQQDNADARAFIFGLTTKGKKLLESLGGLTGYFSETIEAMQQDDINAVWQGILYLMVNLQKTNLIPLRMCFSCQHFGKDHPDGTPHYCHLMEKSLTINNIRIDCPEHKC